MFTSIIKQHEKRAFHGTQDNQASVGWGDLDTALIYQVVRSHRTTYLLYRSDTEILGL